MSDYFKIDYNQDGWPIVTMEGNDLSRKKILRLLNSKTQKIQELEKQLAESVPKSEIKNLGEMWPIFLHWVNDYVGENTNKVGNISYSREDMRYAFQAGYELMQEKAK